MTTEHHMARDIGTIDYSRHLWFYFPGKVIHPYVAIIRGSKKLKDIFDWIFVSFKYFK